MAQAKQPTCSHSQVVIYRRRVTTRARAQDNANAVRYSHEFDRICVYCEYLPRHLSPVSGSCIIGVSKSINIRCV